MSFPDGVAEASGDPDAGGARRSLSPEHLFSLFGPVRLALFGVIAGGALAYGGVEGPVRLAFSAAPLAALAVLAGEMLYRRRALAPAGRTAWFVLTLGLWFMAGSLWSLDPYASLREGWYVIGLAATAFVFDLAGRGFRCRALLTLWGAGLALYGILDAAGTALAPGVAAGHYGGWIVHAPFVNPNHFSALMVFLIPTALYGYYEHRSQRDENASILYFLAFLAMVIASLLARSLGGGAALALIALLTLLERLKRRRSVGVEIGVAGAAILLVAALGMGLNEYFSRAWGVLSGDDVPFSERLLFWKSALSIWRDHPLLGVGAGAFSRIFPAYRPETIRYGLRFVHNEPLQAAAEGGLIAFLILLVGAAVFFRRGWRAYRRASDSQVRNELAGLLIGCAALGLHSLGDFDLHLPAIGAALALGLGRTAVLGGGKPALIRLNKSGRGLAAAAAALLVAGLCVFSGVLETKGFFLDEALRKGRNALEAGRPAEARSYADRVLEARPDSAGALFVRGRAGLREALERPGEEARVGCLAAAGDLERAVRKAPYDYLAWMDLGRANFCGGCLAEAEAPYLKAVELAPNDPLPSYHLGWYYLAAGNGPLGILNLKESVDLNPLKAGGAMKLALAYLAPLPRGCDDQTYRMVGALVPEDAEAHLVFAGLLKEHGRPDLALAELEEALRLSPDRLDILSRIVSELSAKGADEEALARLDEYAREHSRSPEVLTLMGDVWLRGSQPEKALQLYEAAAQLEPHTQKLHEKIGRAREAMGDENLEDYWRSLVHQYPGRAYYNYKLALIYRKKGMWLEALQEAQRAVAKRPNQPSYRDLLADLYLERKMYDDALEQWKSVMRLNRRDPGPLLKMAAVWEKLGVNGKAAASYKSVLKIDPDNRRARERLAALMQSGGTDPAPR